MICQLARNDLPNSKKLSRTTSQYLWCNTDIEWDLPQDIDEGDPGLPLAEYDPAEPDIDKLETFEGFHRPSVSSPSAKTAANQHYGVPVPYDAYHSVQDRRKEHKDEGLDVCTGVDCDAMTCAPYSRVTSKEEEVYERWVRLEKIQKSQRHQNKEDAEDMPNPVVCQRNQVLPVDAECSKMPAAAMMGPQKKRQQNIRVLRCVGDFMGNMQQVAHADHIKDCHRHGPAEDKRALWSIAHGGV